MKNSFFILLLVITSACQSTKIKNETYKIAPSAPELGSIGQSKSLFDLQNEFEERTLPKLENKIRVAIEVVPYTKKLNKIYIAKAKYNQKQSQINYVDSLPNKPELITIRLQDVTGIVEELNAPHNAAVFRLLVDTQKYKMVSGIAVSLAETEIAKIREADTYYLTHSQENKYDIALYKLGKKTNSLAINAENILGYQSSSFCWGISEKGNWYIADMVTGNTNCKGKTNSKIQKKKKSKALFDM